MCFGLCFQEYGQLQKFLKTRSKTDYIWEIGGQDIKEGNENQKKNMIYSGEIMHLKMNVSTNYRAANLLALADLNIIWRNTEVMKQ